MRIESTPRTALFFLSIPLLLLASILSGIGFVLPGLLFPLFGMVVWILWFILIFLIGLPELEDRLHKRSRGLNRGAMIAAGVLLFVGVCELVIVPSIRTGAVPIESLGSDSEEVLLAFNDAFAYNDATALTHQGVDNLLKGQNPYRHPNIVKAVATYNGSYDKVTPLRTGVLSEAFPYPDSSDLGAVWSMAKSNPGRRRLLFIGAVLISLEITNGVACGDTGSLVFALLLVAWVALPKRVWVSAVCMGMAIATKQTAWFYFPFFFVYTMRTNPARKTLAVLGIVALVFAAMNLPFFVQDPALWIRSVLAPMREPMFPVGTGLVTLVTSGLLNIRTSLPFTLLEFGVLVAGILWYYKNCRRYPNTGPILAVLPLFFAWRSLWTYFYYADIIMLAGILVNRQEQNAG
jgi:hypothetical protein